METKQAQAWRLIIAEIEHRVEKHGRGGVTAVAALLGVTRATVSRWLSGYLQGKRVAYDKTVAIMLALGLDPTPFFGSSETFVKMTPEQIMQHAWNQIIEAAHALHREGGGDKTYEEIGKICGVSKATVQRWMKSDEGGEDTPFTNMLRYLKAFDIPLEKALRIQETAQTEKHGVQEHGLTTLGVYAVAGAGPAWEAEEAEPIFHIAVPAYFLRPHITPLFIRGTSMEPTILDQAIVGVNRESGEIIQGEIYAVRLPYEGIVVKRLFIDHEKRAFILRSDNKNGDHQDIRMSFDEGDGFIYGQVIWVFQSYEKIAV